MRKPVFVLRYTARGIFILHNGASYDITQATGQDLESVVGNVISAMFRPTATYDLRQGRTRRG